MEDYFREIEDVEATIEEFRKNIYENEFKGNKEEKINPYYFPLWSYGHELDLFRDLTELAEVFGIEVLDKNRRGLENWINLIENIPKSSKWGDVNGMFDNIKEVFQKAKQELTDRIGLLDKEEKDRLNEAFNCYLQDLNYSSVVMSVSAIESRLFSLMMLKSPSSKLEDLTLGQLIREYTDHKEKYAYVIPEKHEPLLDYCNTYRVFSVHPKKAKITRATATSILCMTCSFLFDKTLKAKIEE